MNERDGAHTVSHVPETTTVRFFTSAALRPGEEVDGAVVPWLPRAITVEYAGDQPVTGLWRTRSGARRVCWYGTAATAGIIAGHQERYDDEPFWVVGREAGPGQHITVLECDHVGTVRARRRWRFDRSDMPAREEERSPSGELGVMRTYECITWGTVVSCTEQHPGGEEVLLPRPHRFPIAELAGEPYPCGGIIEPLGARVVEVLGQNEAQVRALAVYRDGATWRRGLATIAANRGWDEQLRPILDFAGAQVAPLAGVGKLEHPRPRDRSLAAVVEALPDGRTLEDVVLTDGPLAVADALDLALEVAAVARRAHAAGHPLGGIRPELIFVRAAGDHLQLEAVAHRGPAVLSATFWGDRVQIFPVFTAAFGSPSDAHGLAQLVWHLVTGGHPELATADVRFDQAWREQRQYARRPQPWTGPAGLGAALERVLRGPVDGADFDGLVAALTRLRGQAAG